MLQISALAQCNLFIPFGALIAISSKEKLGFATRGFGGSLPHAK
jgi:hypothetical protein